MKGGVKNAVDQQHFFCRRPYNPGNTIPQGPAKASAAKLGFRFLNHPQHRYHLLPPTVPCPFRAARHHILQPARAALVNNNKLT